MRLRTPSARSRAPPWELSFTFHCPASDPLPSSTVDMSTADGAGIEIELRSPDELFAHGGQRTVVEGAEGWNPVFDVTPASLIDAIVTERGVVERPDAARMAARFGADR